MPPGIKEQLLFCLPGGFFPAAPHPAPPNSAPTKTTSMAILAFIFLKIQKT